MLTDEILAQPTPLTEHIQVIEIAHVDHDLRVLARVVVDPHNPILAGHYPGRPIFPGVCLIECAHRAVLVAAYSCGFTAQLDAVPTARFMDAVIPPDTVDIRAQITRGGSRWRVAATLHGQRGLAAKVALHYNVSGGVS